MLENKINSPHISRAQPYEPYYPILSHTNTHIHIPTPTHYVHTHIYAHAAIKAVDLDDKILPAVQKPILRVRVVMAGGAR
jgi:hypothetical protein